MNGKETVQPRPGISGVLECGRMNRQRAGINGQEIVEPRVVNGCILRLNKFMDGINES